MRTTHFCSLVLSALFLTSISAYAVQTEKDCEAMIANGREAVARGNKLAAHPRTKLESKEVIAKGNDAIERGQACLHAVRAAGARADKLADKKADCKTMLGNWYEKGSYCYVVRNYGGTLSEEDNPKALRCNQAGLGYDTWTKECYTVSLPAKSNCGKEYVTDFGQKGPPSCAPLVAMQCMARGGIWNSTDEPNHCEEKAAAGMPPAFVTGIKPGKAPPVQVTEAQPEPPVQPVVEPVRQPSEATGRNFDPRLEVLSGVSFVKGKTTGSNTEYFVGIGLMLSYYTKEDCISKVTKQAAIAGAHVEAEPPMTDPAAHCAGLFSPGGMGRVLEKDALGNKLPSPGKQMRYSLRLQVTNFESCLQSFVSELAIPSVELEFDGEKDPEEAAIKACKRLYPDVSTINRSYPYRIHFIGYNKIPSLQQERGPVPDSFPLVASDICGAMEQARPEMEALVNLTASSRTQPVVWNFTAFALSKDDKMLCRLAPSDEPDRKNLPDCKCDKGTPPVGSPD